MLRYTTAGESHGPGLVAVVEGVPAGLRVSAEQVNAQLARRMQGYGRGARMQIESDRIEWLGGVRAGETIGSPVAMLIRNRDWENWRDVMAPEGAPGEKRERAVTRPRPGHADLAGALKYDRADARDILERASARETAARVAAGAVGRLLLAELGIEIGSHVVSLGGIDAEAPDELPWPLADAADRSQVRVLNAGVEAAIIEHIDAAKAAGDTLGGVVEVVARGVPIGIGSHVSWDRRLDGRLAAQLMSLPAVKGVEIGLGFEAARRPGSEVHDEIAGLAKGGGAVGRLSNRAGGIEGGMTTGEPLVVRVAMKPLSTLMAPLGTIDLATGTPARAETERSDVTAVPALGVIAEAVMALVLADALLEKSGGDSLAEVRRNLEAYVAAVARRLPSI